MITKKLGKEKVRGCVHFLPVTSLFGIHLFLVHKKYPSIIHFVFHNIHLSYYTSLFAHFWIVITNFALLDYCNIFNLYGNVFRIPQYIIYNTHVFLLVSITQLTEIFGECSEYGLILVDQMEKAMYNSNIYPNSNTSGCSAVMLEHSLFEVGTSPDVVKGVFYLLPIFHQGKLFLRYVIIEINNSFCP